CSIIGVSGRNSAPSLVSVEGIAPHHWCQTEEKCPIIGVSWWNSITSLVSVGAIASHHWCQGRNSITSLVSVGGIASHHWCQWEEFLPCSWYKWCLIHGVSGSKEE
ncbi:unnamed protein product, partial [Staurois parvus]